jgi:hypothetical protein
MKDRGNSRPAVGLSGHRFRVAALAGWCALLAGCGNAMSENKSNPARPDINAVLAAHDQRMMAMPGVVGVYVGLLDDNVTPCLKIMLVRRDAKLEQALPREIEGYRVVPEVTGEIRPLGSK